jgi:hypothetical protein
MRDSSEDRYINTLLEYLAAYGIDHHSRAIADILPDCIPSALPKFNAYLESRILQTDQIKDINKGMLN